MQKFVLGGICLLACLYKVCSFGIESTDTSRPAGCVLKPGVLSDVIIDERGIGVLWNDSRLMWALADNDDIRPYALQDDRIWYPKTMYGMMLPANLYYKFKYSFPPPLRLHDGIFMFNQVFANQDLDNVPGVNGTREPESSIISFRVLSNSLSGMIAYRILLECLFNPTTSIPGSVAYGTRCPTNNTVENLRTIVNSNGQQGELPISPIDGMYYWEIGEAPKMAFHKPYMRCLLDGQRWGPDYRDLYRPHPELSMPIKNSRYPFYPVRGSYEECIVPALKGEVTFPDPCFSNISIPLDVDCPPTLVGYNLPINSEMSYFTVSNDCGSTNNSIYANLSRFTNRNNPQCGGQSSVVECPVITTTSTTTTTTTTTPTTTVTTTTVPTTTPSTTTTTRSTTSTVKTTTPQSTTVTTSTTTSPSTSITTATTTEQTSKIPTPEITTKAMTTTTVATTPLNTTVTQQQENTTQTQVFNKTTPQTVSTSGVTTSTTEKMTTSVNTTLSTTTFTSQETISTTTSASTEGSSTKTMLTTESSSVSSTMKTSTTTTPQSETSTEYRSQTTESQELILFSSESDDRYRKFLEKAEDDTYSYKNETIEFKLTTVEGFQNKVAHDVQKQTDAMWEFYHCTCAPYLVPYQNNYTKQPDSVLTGLSVTSLIMGAITALVSVIFIIWCSCFKKTDQRRNPI